MESSLKLRTYTQTVDKHISTDEDDLGYMPLLFLGNCSSDFIRYMCHIIVGTQSFLDNYFGFIINFSSHIIDAVCDQLVRNNTFNAILDEIFDFFAILMGKLASKETFFRPFHRQRWTRSDCQGCSVCDQGFLRDDPCFNAGGGSNTYYDSDLSSGGCDSDITSEDMIDEGKEFHSLLNHLSPECEQPVSHIYIHPSSDDDSVSTLGSLPNHSLHHVLPCTVQTVRGTWNDQKAVALLSS